MEEETDDSRTSLRLWDIASGAPVGDVMDTRDTVRQILPVDDGTRAFTIGTSGVSLWDLSGTVEIGIRWEANGSLKQASLSSDRERVIVYGSGHLFEWNVGKILEMRGQTLAKAVCATVVPGGLSRLSVDELKASPLLSPVRDGDACSGR